jgi:tetratricopeptide (TPR) repeat protein
VLSHASTSLTALKRYDEAVDLLDSALKTMPDNTLLLGHLAHTLIMRDTPERAAALSQQAMALEPNNQSHVALLTTAWRLMGDARHEETMGYDKFVRIFDLEPPRGFSDMDGFNTELAGYLETLHPDTREYFDQSLRFGTQTPEQIFGAGHRLVDLLQERLSEAVARYIAELPADAAHPFTGKRRGGFAYSGSWSSRLRDSGFHLDHIHPAGWISSCYYVAVPDAVKDETEKQGWIKFGQPTMRQDLAPLRSVQPRPGRLVLFPSYMWHGTNPFRAASPRTTIAFDVVPT